MSGPLLCSLDSTIIGSGMEQDVIEMVGDVRVSSFMLDVYPVSMASIIDWIDGDVDVAYESPMLGKHVLFICGEGMVAS